MNVANFELNLYGDESKQYYNIKDQLLSYLNKIKLPVKIIENKNCSQIKVAYKESIFEIDEKNQANQLKELFSFLLKVNPKTGKICKCSDCNNCPSKRMDETFLKQLKVI